MLYTLFWSCCQILNMLSSKCCMLVCLHGMTRDQVKNLRINEVCLPGVIYSKFALASNDKSDCNAEDFIKADLS